MVWYLRVKVLQRVCENNCDVNIAKSGGKFMLHIAHPTPKSGEINKITICHKFTQFTEMCNRKIIFIHLFIYNCTVFMQNCRYHFYIIAIATHLCEKVISDMCMICV